MFLIDSQPLQGESEWRKQSGNAFDPDKDGMVEPVEIE
jgi:hypothetical protein